MRTQWNKHLFKAILLLLLMTVMIAWASSGIVADTGASSYSVTFQFDSSYIRQITITYPDPDKPGTMKTAPLVSGEPVDIAVYDEVTVTIVPQFGYRPIDATDIDNGSQYTLAEIEDDAGTETVESGWTCYFSQLQSNVNAELVFDEKEYNVQAIDFDLSGNVSYSYVSGSITLNQLLTSNNKLFRYNDAENRVELPVVSLAGYEFKGWRIRLGEDGTYDDAKEVDGKYYIAHTTTNSYIDRTGIIQVYPVLEAQPQEVYREDRVYIDQDTMGGHLTEEGKPVVWSAPTGEMISALSIMDDDINGYKEYLGYTLLQNSADASGYQYPQYTVKIPTTVSPKPNYLYRFYVPNTYWLSFENVSSSYVEEHYGADRPAYIYGQRKAIADPTKTGYTFMGWEIKLIVNGVEKTIPVSSEFAFPQAGAYYENGVRVDPNDIYAADVENGEGEIVLSAVWTPNVYNVTYNWNVPEDLIETMNGLTENALLLSDYSRFVFDQTNGDGEAILAIPAPVRPGYVFAGWALRDENGDVADTLVMENGVLKLPTNRYASNLDLIASWTAEKYTVVFDGAGATTAPDASIRPEVTYDGYLIINEEQLALVVPARTGHTFKGYYSAPNGEGIQYVNVVNGTAVLTNALWKVDGENGGTVTLYAYWEVNDYEISVDIGGTSDPDALGGVTITVIPEVGESFTVGINETFELPYGTQFSVRIDTPAGYKIVSFDGDASFSGHTNHYLCADMTVDAWDDGLKTFTANLLPMQTLTLTQANVNYPNETLQNLPIGKYVAYLDDGTEFRFRISAQSATQDISTWFGTEVRTVELVYCGDGINSSDSDRIVLELQARPAAPNFVSEGVGEIDSIHTESYSIIINMVNSAKGWYEFAIVEGGANDAIRYGANFEFTELKPGTLYDIYIRKAATATEPHGIARKLTYRTDTTDYVNQAKEELEQLKGENPGPITSALIDQAIKEIEELGKAPTDTFYQTVQTIIQTIKEKELQIAIAKDRAINDLKELLDNALQSDSFTDEKAAELNTLYENAVASITAATDEEEVQTHYNSAVIAMKSVPVHRLTDADRTIFLQSMLGLDQSSVLTLIRDVDFETLSRAVDQAIRSGKIEVDGFMTQEEAEQLLRALDVVASYRFEMTNSDKVREGDVFTVRLTIPENLRSMTGLQVAYYDDVTGVIELLETRVEGDELVFTTKRVADFVILADPTVELTGVIVALGAILLCQIVAIAFILISRVRSKKTVTHASIAFPAVFLTVHFLPVNGEVIAMVMLGAVIVLQIVLMALLLSSAVTHLPRKKKNAPADDGDAAAEDENVSPYARIYAEEDVGTERAEDLSEQAPAFDENENAEVEADFGAAAILMDTDEMSDEDPFIMYREDSTDGAPDESFIEPAATTRYSLPDEDFAAYGSDDGEDAAYADEYSDGYTEEYTDEDADAAEGDEALYYDESAYGETAYADEDAEEVYADDALYEDGEAYADESLYSDEVYDNNEAYGDYPYEGEQTEGAEDGQTSEEELLQDEVYFAPAEEDSDDTDPMYRYDE